MKYQTEQTTNLPSLYPQGMTCKGGCRQSRQEGCQKQFSATNHNFNKPQNLFSLLREMSRGLRVTEGCQCANLRFAQAFNERPYDANLQIHLLVTDKNKSRIHRRGDHWSPLFKLFKLFFLYKSSAQTNHKASSLCCTCSVANQHIKPNEQQGSLW